MYIVISKPKRKSVKDGVVHCMVVSIQKGWHETCLPAGVRVFTHRLTKQIQQYQCQ